MAPGPRGPDAPNEVADYYDRNTRRFLAFGGGSKAHAIHRQLWGPGVADARQAADYVNILLGDAIESAGLGERFVLLDLGCGVGGTMFALAKRFPHGRYHGVTISSRQYELALSLRDEIGYADNCVFHCADFESLALDVEADLVIAVESFVHAQSAAGFFAAVHRHVKPGGQLVVVDDFIADGGIADHSRAARSHADIESFRDGWRLANLDTVGRCLAAATAAGLKLIEDRDLSPLIRLDRPRDRMVAVLARATRPLGLVRVPLFANLIGGAALTRGLRRGDLNYRWLCFRAVRAAE